MSEAHNDFRRELERAASADTTLTVVDLSGRADFAALSAGHKAQAIRMLSIAALEGGLEEVHLDSLELDLACAEAIATLLRAPRLRVLTLTANKLNEAAMQRIARGLNGHPSLATLALSDQKGGAISTFATKELLDAMETVPTLIKLRLGTVHDEALRRRYLALENTHVSDMRTRGKKDAASTQPAAADASASPAAADGSGGGGGAGAALAVAELFAARAAATPNPARADVWGDEAARIASSEETKLGRPDNEDDTMPWRDPSTTYVLTGCAEWRGATKSERRAVIEAFSTNTRLTSVHMSDSMIDDDLARAWASVLACPTCIIESLTLESNPISSSGIEVHRSPLTAHPLDLEPSGPNP